MDLTMAERRAFLEEIQKLVLSGAIKKEDQDEIFRVCLAACDRSLGEAMSEGELE